jgi:hypothetical protein
VSLLGNTQALQEVRVRFTSETPDELQWCDGAEWVTLPELAEVGGRADVTVEVVDACAHGIIFRDSIKGLHFSSAARQSRSLRLA